MPTDALTCTKCSKPWSLGCCKPSNNIRPEVRALAERGNVTLEEWKNFRGNSWEFELIIPRLTDEALDHVARMMCDNCRIDQRRPFLTYNDAVPGLIVPVLLERLKRRPYDYEAALREWNTATGEPMNSAPILPDESARLLRCKLLLEEVIEHINAMGCQVVWVNGAGPRVFPRDGDPADLVQAAHELADVLYVAFGTAVSMGLPTAAVFEEVHAANMRKMGPDGKPVVRADGKVLKPEGWRPADVAGVLGRCCERDTDGDGNCDRHRRR